MFTCVLFGPIQVLRHRARRGSTRGLPLPCESPLSQPCRSGNEMRAPHKERNSHKRLDTDRPSPIRELFGGLQRGASLPIMDSWKSPRCEESHMQLIRKGVMILLLACSATAFGQEASPATQFIVRVLGPGNARQSSQVEAVGGLRTLTCSLGRLGVHSRQLITCEGEC
jgi:hypothetical protein